MGGLGEGEFIIILVIVLVIAGGGRLPSVADALGRAVQNATSQRDPYSVTLLFIAAATIVAYLLCIVLPSSR